MCCGSLSQVLSTSFWRGLHLFRCQGPNLDFDGQDGRVGARRIWPFGHLKLKIFAGPQGPVLRVVQEWRPSSASIGIFIGIDWLLQVLKKSMASFAGSLAGDGVRHVRQASGVPPASAQRADPQKQPHGGAAGRAEPHRQSAAAMASQRRKYGPCRARHSAAVTSPQLC